MAPGVAQSLVSGASRPVLAANLMLFEAMARDRGRRVDYGHVKAHSGNPWNELADWMCSRDALALPVTAPRLPD
eukprot:11218534-Lingulodinium_polyedra.AAC.1